MWLALLFILLRAKMGHISLWMGVCVCFFKETLFINKTNKQKIKIHLKGDNFSIKRKERLQEKEKENKS